MTRTALACRDAASHPRTPQDSRLAIRAKCTRWPARRDRRRRRDRARREDRSGRNGREVAIPAGATLLEAARRHARAHRRAQRRRALTGYPEHPARPGPARAQSTPIQPELRAIDAYNPRERLVGYLRSSASRRCTRARAGRAHLRADDGREDARHASRTRCCEPVAMVAATLGDGARDGGKAPGTRPKAVAMLREALLKARSTRASAPTRPRRSPARDARSRAPQGDAPPRHRAPPPGHRKRAAPRRGVRLRSSSTARPRRTSMLERSSAAKVPVLPHPTMCAPAARLENASMETAARCATRASRSRCRAASRATCRRRASCSSRPRSPRARPGPRRRRCVDHDRRGAHPRRRRPRRLARGRQGRRPRALRRRSRSSTRRTASASSSTAAGRRDTFAHCVCI
jgi:hypothetical protein